VRWYITYKLSYRAPTANHAWLAATSAPAARRS
jgi:hypothetical protein